MAKKSAGILLFRKNNTSIEVLLAHPGGPFWSKKDKGAWSIPKGEFKDVEDGLLSAKREYEEELGVKPPDGNYHELGTVKLKSGKEIYAWAVEGDFDVATLKSNEFELEWPPKSGQLNKYPEVDLAKWFQPQIAKIKINQAQAEFVDVLLNKLDIKPPPDQPTQISLL